MYSLGLTQYTIVCNINFIGLLGPLDQHGEFMALECTVNTTRAKEGGAAYAIFIIINPLQGYSSLSVCYRSSSSNVELSHTSLVPTETSHLQGF